MIKALRTVGRYIILMGRVFARPERMRMFFRQYINEIEQLGVNSIGIVKGAQPVETKNFSGSNWSIGPGPDLFAPYRPGSRGEISSHDL